MIATPRPTITRNAQKTMATGGRSRGAKAFRPWTLASTPPAVIRLPSLGMESSQRLAAAFWSGQATIWKACSLRVSQKASMAASLAGCTCRSCLPPISPTTSCRGATTANMPMAIFSARLLSASCGSWSSRHAEAAPTTRAVVR
jgi:hypothetical protein